MGAQGWDETCEEELEVFDSKSQTGLKTPRISVESAEVPRLYVSDSDSHEDAKA